MKELKKTKVHNIETSKVMLDEGVEQEVVMPIEKPKPQQVKGLPLEIAKQRSETMSEISTTTIAAVQENTQSAVSVEIVPKRTALIEEVQVSEKEELSKTQVELEEQRAQVSFSVQQGLEIQELYIKDAQSPLQKDKTVPEQKAKQDIVPTQAIEISDLVAHEHLKKLETSIESQTVATTHVTTHDAVIVQETLSSHTSQENDQVQKPQPSHATETVLPSQGLQVTEVIETESETIYNREQTTSIKPKYTIKPIEVSEKTEIIPEDRPGKFNPALIVATEIAKTNIVPQHTYTVQETVAPESAATYTPSRQPLTEQADLIMGAKSSIAVQEIIIQETEDTLPEAVLPESSTASDAIRTQQSIIASTIQPQSPIEELKVEIFGEKKPTISIPESMPIETSEVKVAESETILEIIAPESGKRADVSLNLLPVGESEQLILNESELPFEAKQPVSVTPKTTQDLVSSLSTTVTTTLETHGMCEPIETKTEQAKVDYSLKQSTVVSEQITHEKELEFLDKPKSIGFTAAQTLEEHVAISGISQAFIETEKSFETSPNELISAQQSQTEPLKVSATSEIISSDLPEPFETLAPKDAKAKVQTDEMQIHLVEENPTFDTIGDFDGKLKLQKASAEILVQTADSLQVTEILSDFREQEKDFSYIIAQAKGELSPYKAVSTLELTTADNVEDYQAEKPLAKQATTTQEALESVMIEEQSTAERESEFTRPDSPEKKHGIVSYDGLKMPVFEETITHEAHGSLDLKAPEGKIATSELMPFESIAIVETMETFKEKEFESIIPQGESASSGVNQFMQTSQIYETIPEHGIGKLEAFKPQSDVVKLSSEDTELRAPICQLEETRETPLPLTIESTQEKLAMPAVEPINVPQQSTTQSTEQVVILTEETPEHKTAEVVQTFVQAAQISNVIASEREESFDRPDSPEKKHVVTSFEAFQAPSAGEVFSSDTVENLLIESTTERIAQSAHDILEAVSVLETIVDQTEVSLDTVKPKESQAIINVNELTSVQKTETLIQDQTTDFLAPELLTQKVEGHQNIVDYRVPFTSQVQPIETLGEVEELKLVQQNAASNVTEMNLPISHETQVTDQTSVLEIDKTDDKTANVVQSLLESTVVFESIALDTEKTFDKTNVEEKSGNVIYDALKTSVKEEQFTGEGLTEFETLEPETKQPQVIQNTLSSVDITEITASEKETLLKVDKTSEFQATPAFEELTIPIQSETTIFGSENLFEAEALNVQQGTLTRSVEHKVGAKIEIIAADSLGTVKDFESVEQKASAEYTDMRVANTTETAVVDSLGNVDVQKIEEHVAQVSAFASEPTQVTEVILNEQEIELPEIEQPEVKQGALSYEGLKVSLKQEIISSENTSQFETIETERKFATTEGIEVQAIQVSQPLVNENEMQLDSNKPQMVVAQPNVEEMIVPEVSQVDSEASISDLKINKEKLETASTKLENELKAASSEMLILMESAQNVEKIPFESKESVQSISDQLFVATSSEKTVMDQFSDLKEVGDLKKKAKTQIDEVNSVTVTEQIVGESEGDFLKEVKPEEQTTNTVKIESTKAPIITEVLTSDTMGKLEPFTMESRTAVSDTTEIESILVQEVLTLASEKDLQIETPQNFQANTNITELTAHQTTTVVAESSTAEIKHETHEQLNAVQNIDSEHKTPFVQEVVLGEFVGEVKDQKPFEQNATPGMTNLIAPQTELQFIGDQTHTLPEETQPENKKATQTQTTVESITVHEVSVTEHEKPIENAETKITKVSILYEPIRASLTQEVIPSDTIEQMSISDVTSLKPITSTVPHQALTVLENTVHENENILDKQTPDFGQAHIQINPVEATIISTTQITEQEKYYEQDEHDTQTPVVKLESELKTPLTLENVLNESLSPSDTLAYTVQSATPSFTEVQSVTIESTDVIDQTGSLHDSQKPSLKEASLSHIPKDSISVTEILLHDDLVSTKPLELHNQVASSAIEGQIQTAVREETFASDTFIVFEKTPSDKAQATQDTLLSLNVQQQLIAESHDTFQPESLPDTKKADEQYSQHTSVAQIGEIVPNDTIQDFTAPIIDTENAHTFLGDALKAPLAMELNVHDSLSDGSAQQSITCTAAKVQEPNNSLQIQETQALDLTEKLHIDKNIETQVTVTQETMKSVAIQDIQTQETVQDSINKLSIDDKHATLEIEALTAPEQEIIQTTETFEDRLTDITQHVLGQRSIDSNQIAPESIQTYLNETVIDYSPQEKPIEGHGTISIDSQKLPTVTEALVQEAIKPFEISQDLETSAKIDIIPMVIPMAEVADVQENISSFDIQSEKTRKASVSGTDVQGLIIEEMTTIESESDLIVEKPKTDRAHPEWNALSSALKEERILPETFENFQNAGPLLEEASFAVESAHKIPEVFETSVEEKEKQIRLEVPDESKAKLMIEEIILPTVSEVVTQDNVGGLESFKSEPLVAKTSQDESKSVLVQEEIALYKESVIKDDKLSERRASISQDGLKISMKTETNTVESHEDLSISKRKSSIATLVQEEILPVCVEEILVKEQEVDLEKIKTPTERKASVTLEALKVTTSSELSVEETSQELQIEKTKKSQASVVQNESKAIEINEILLPQSVDTLEIKFPDKVEINVTMTDSKLTTNIATEIITEEESAPYETKPLIDGKFSNISIVPQKSISVEEITLHEHSSEHKLTVLPKHKLANTNLQTITPLESQEYTMFETLQNLKQDKQRTQTQKAEKKGKSERVSLTVILNLAIRHTHKINITLNNGFLHPKKFHRCRA